MEITLMEGMVLMLDVFGMYFVRKKYVLFYALMLIALIMLIFRWTV
jgi:hypothetical protein